MVRKRSAQKIIGIITVIAQAAYAVYSLIQQNYIIMLECLAGVVLVIAPVLIDKRFRLDLPEPLYLFYFIFIFAAIFLGSGLGFYSRVPRWDDILHSLSGALLAVLGFAIVMLYNKRSERVSGTVSAGFMAVFAFCFALAVGAVWEIYEYTGDGLLNMSMQRFLAPDGSGLVGRAALYDTMKDIIVDASSALATSVIGGIVVSKRRKREP
jgi:hypothetical protein